MKNEFTNLNCINLVSHEHYVKIQLKTMLKLKLLV